MLAYGRKIPSPQLQFHCAVAGYGQEISVPTGVDLGYSVSGAEAILIKGKDCPSIVAPFCLDNQ